jgi:hypothetical protein
MTTLDAGSAFAEEGGGNGGLMGQPYQVAPNGFYSMDPTYQHEQEMEAYVINQERAWQIAHARDHNAPIAQTTSPSHG